MDGFNFSTEIRVRFAETDAQGVAHNTAYYVPARFDDRVLIHARCLDIRGARFRYEYAIERDDGTLLADGWTRHAVVDAKTFRPVRVPAWFVEAIATAEAA